MPQDNPGLKQTLEGKLKEYEARLANVKNAENPNRVLVGTTQVMDAAYKKLILQELLNNGEVNTDAIKSKISEVTGSIDETAFNNAVGVIEDYVKTGGKNLEGGTGLSDR